MRVNVKDFAWSTPMDCLLCTNIRNSKDKIRQRDEPEQGCYLTFMVREISAGGVVIRKREGSWWMAAIEPAGDPAGAKKSKPAKPLLALPKGLVDPGEKALETALREVFEETGVRADLIAKLADIKYVYTRAWGDRQRVFKIVSFYLMMYRSGRINDITEEMRIEVTRACWVPLVEAAALLAYKGEKQMAKRAQEYVISHPELEAD